MGTQIVGCVLDQYREKKQEQVIKNIISQLQATLSLIDRFSQLRPFLRPASDNQHLTRLLNSSFQFFQCTQHIPVLDMRVTVSLTTHSNSFTFNLAVTGQLYLPFPTKTAQFIGPASDNVLLSASSNLTCINYSSPSYTGLTNSVPSFCSTWVLWNNTNAPTQESSFSAGPTHIHVSPLTPLDLASWSS